MGQSEVDKWAENIEERRVIADFLEWMNANHYVVAEFVGQFHSMRPTKHTHHALLDEFYRVDNVQLEKERRAILEEVMEDEEIVERGDKTPG